MVTRYLMMVPTFPTSTYSEVNIHKVDSTNPLHLRDQANDLFPSF